MNKKKLKQKQIAQKVQYGNYERVNPSWEKGLDTQQVNERIAAGDHNTSPPALTRSVKQIVFSNVFTLFNILNVFLAVCIFLVGAYKSLLFIFVAVFNTAIGIFQELRSKKAVDKLSIMGQSYVNVIRNSEKIEIPQPEIVLDDIIYVTLGDQVPADCETVHSLGLEVDESLLTGESDNMRKQDGDHVYSGSFIASGSAYLRVVAVGQSNFATKLANEAKTEKRPQSEMMNILNKIIGILTIIIIPVGAALFYRQHYVTGLPMRDSVLGAASAMIGMIPEGLMLLTSVSFAVSAMKLARKKTLVQTMPSIETLARADVLCLDKTGTITDGSLQVQEVVPTANLDENKIKEILANMMGSLPDTNTTATAIREAFGQNDSLSNNFVPFSSERKWSAVNYTDDGCYIIGAPAFVLKDIPENIDKQIKENASKGLRVLCLAHSPDFAIDATLPKDITCEGLVVISDHIRDEAPSTFAYFEEQGVALKVISGDDAATVSEIAQQADITNAEHYIDMSTLDENPNYDELVDQYSVFGRVTPYQKRELLWGLQRQDHIVCMTGDGVNDVLALKEADCSVAMPGGSSAARDVADFVLLNGNFDSMISVMQEGRRVVNNIEQVASLYLVKTIYSTLLAILFMFLPYNYPFQPLQLSPVNTLTVGVPSFVLALRPHYERIKNRFLANILENSLPAAITVILNILVITLAQVWFDLSYTESSTMCIILIGAVGFMLIYKLCTPMTKKLMAMFIILIAAFVAEFIIFGSFLDLGSLFTRNVFFYVPLIFASNTLFNTFSSFMIRITNYIQKHKKTKNKRRHIKKNKQKNRVA